MQASPAAAQVHVHGSSGLVDPTAEAKKPPLYFSDAQYGAVGALCQLIIPRTADSGGAMEAGVPAFIDLLTSENQDYQRRLSGGLAWLDAFCMKQFGSGFMKCSEAQQKTVLDAIAYRSNGEQDGTLVPGVDFFAFMRGLVLDGYFTSKIGIEYLQFEGNRALASFPGCPEPRG
jgi:hypothetical protein